ncbi:MAG: TSUP family transporter [Nitrospiraceae bacterium]
MRSVRVRRCSSQPKKKGLSRNHGSVVLFLPIGLTTGLTSGSFGIGGGLLLIPALIYLAGYS